MYDAESTWKTLKVLFIEGITLENIYKVSVIIYKQEVVKILQFSYDPGQCESHYFIFIQQACTD